MECNHRLVGVKEIAVLLGVSTQRVANMRATGGLPPPRWRVACGDLWDHADIVEWFTGRGRKLNLRADLARVPAGRNAKRGQWSDAYRARLDAASRAAYDELNARRKAERHEARAEREAEAEAAEARRAELDEWLQNRGGY